MKPGEYIGTDGRTYAVASVALRRNEDTPTVTVNLDGSSAILCAPHLRPGHPDFPAAVEALQALVPEKEPFEWKSRIGRYRFHEEELQSRHYKRWLTCNTSMQDAFEAGRCYQRERGDE